MLSLMRQLLYSLNRRDVLRNWISAVSNCRTRNGRRSWAAPLLFCVMLITSQCADNELASTSGLTGKGGSLARFAVTPTHLYAVDNTTLHVYKFELNGSTTLVNSVDLGG